MTGKQGSSPESTVRESKRRTRRKFTADEVILAADFLLIHGNGVSDPDRIRRMVRQTRSAPGYAAKPVLFNEDDHFDFCKPINNCIAALSEHASWGYFDFRMRGEGFEDGFQSVPVDWGIGSERKVAFFRLISEITGRDPEAPGDRSPIEDKDKKKEMQNEHFLRGLSGRTCHDADSPLPLQIPGQG
jgi:hypothetical protein